MLRRVLLFVGIAAAAAAAGVVLLRDRTPVLDEEELEQAGRVWVSRGPKDYDLRLRVESEAREDQVYEVQIRDAKVVALALNGTELTRPSQSYSVGGLFTTMERELEMARDRNPRPGQRRNATLLARFHEELGFPCEFKVIAPDRQSVAMIIEELRLAGGRRIYP